MGRSKNLNAHRAWLVKVDNLRVANKADGNTKAALHPSRVLPGLLVGHIEEVDTLQPLGHRLLELCLWIRGSCSLLSMGPGVVSIPTYSPVNHMPYPYCQVLVCEQQLMPPRKPYPFLSAPT